jgi:3-polyprenyl-4-hydroxybenzoate decarboxylase
MELILKNVKKKDFPVLKSLAKSLGFEIVQEVEKPYNPEFVKEILEAREELKQGKGIRMTMEELKELCK